jgi:hypothetical protein
MIYSTFAPSKQLNAADAKRLADEYGTRNVVKILDQIKTAASVGKYSMYLPEMDYLERVVVTKHLESLGYEVKHSSDQRDGDYTTVSWA